MTTATSETPAIEQGATWLVRLGRLGYIAKGVVYIVVGFLAVEAAVGAGGGTTDTQGALRVIGDAPFGKVLLFTVAIGLLGYAVWRLVSALVDGEGRGDKPSSIMLRTGDALRGLAYGSLGVWTIRYLSQGYAESTDRARATTRRALDFPAGRWLVIAGGLGIIGYALYQLYRAVTKKFLKRLDLSSASARTRTLIEHLGGFGVAARAIVFGMIGLLIARAGWTFNASEAGGIEKSLDAIAEYRFLFPTVAVGLIAFGILQLATARYRIMRAT
ncbi:MAG: DUF1206 domain-containing protein [Gemmatimonadaceae bacterium]